MSSNYCVNSYLLCNVQKCAISFNLYIIETLKKIIKNKVVQKIFFWVASLAAFFFIITIANAFLISHISRDKTFHNINHLEVHDVGVVFGTTPKMLNGLPNSYYTYRIRGAVNLYKEGKIKKILVSGDNRSAYYNEPKAMRKSLEDRGVKKEDIIEDFAGRDTYDSALRARNIFGINKPLYITQRFQADRALAIAKWNNIDAEAFVVPETRDEYVRAKIYFREYLARTKMLFTLLLNLNTEVGGKFELIK